VPGKLAEIIERHDDDFDLGQDGGAPAIEHDAMAGQRSPLADEPGTPNVDGGQGGEDFSDIIEGEAVNLDALPAETKSDGNGGKVTKIGKRGVA
jgi:hypothetical protein